MRELMVVFSGNEISLGVMLATWLFWTAAGSLLCSGLALGERNLAPHCGRSRILARRKSAAHYLGLRASKSLFQTVPGELVGPVPVLLASLVCLSVFCVVAGALFVAAARMYGHERAVDARSAVSAAYLLEAAGSALGGIVASLVLLRFLSPFQIACIVSPPQHLHGRFPLVADEPQATWFRCDCGCAARNLTSRSCCALAGERRASTPVARLSLARIARFHLRKPDGR